MEGSGKPRFKPTPATDSHLDAVLGRSDSKEKAKMIPKSRAEYMERAIAFLTVE